MVSTAGDALNLASTVLVKLKAEIISECNFPLGSLIRLNPTYSYSRHYTGHYTERF